MRKYEHNANPKSLVDIYVTCNFSYKTRVSRKSSIRTASQANINTVIILTEYNFVA